MHDFNPGNRIPSRPERLKPQHGTREPFYCPMILLREIIKIFDVTNNDGRLVGLVVMRDRRCLRTTLINGIFLWDPLGAIGLV